MLWCSQVNIARALSVIDGKGDVSWVASQSREGTDSRGNFEAWVSGPEKSRHGRQDVADCVGCGADETLRRDGDASAFGFVARSFEISGREERGIGGGALPASVGPGLCVLTIFPFVVGSSSLFIPNDKADLAATGGTSRGGSFLSGDSGTVDSCLVGLRGGSDGITGGGEISAVMTLDVDFADFNGVLTFPFS